MTGATTAGDGRTAVPAHPRLLRHGRVDLALHQLADGRGRPLLLLHGLGEASPPDRPAVTSPWRGPVHALDFTGHGLSTVPAGGGYSCEVLMGDVDIALAELGPCTVLGRGLGAYVALLIAAARTDLVHGAVLADGPGLAGGSTGPSSATYYRPAEVDGTAPDPFALFELSTDIRPADYAAGFARLVLAMSPMATPLVVAARQRPPWLQAVADEPGVVAEPVVEGLARYAGD
jgi:pimeloyl-ACP methyl ester carboxylesterase